MCSSYTVSKLNFSEEIMSKKFAGFFVLFLFLQRLKLILISFKLLYFDIGLIQPPT